MSRQYPRYGGSHKRYRAPVLNEQCDACDQSRVGWVEIQYGWMRGSDDERAFCCEHHYAMVTKHYDVIQFLQDCEEKAAAKVESPVHSTQHTQSEMLGCDSCDHGETYADDQYVFCQLGLKRESRECRKRQHFAHA